MDDPCTFPSRRLGTLTSTSRVVVRRQIVECHFYVQDRLQTPGNCPKDIRRSRDHQHQTTPHRDPHPATNQQLRFAPARFSLGQDEKVVHRHPAHSEDTYAQSQKPGVGQRRTTAVMSIGGSDLDKYIQTPPCPECDIDSVQGHYTTSRVPSDPREPSPRAMLQGTRAADRRGQCRWSRCASDGRHRVLSRIYLS
jgi:hypothetical protein